MRAPGRTAAGFCAGLLLFAVCAAAQTADPAKTIESLRNRLKAQQLLLHDWAGLIRYGSENTEIPPPKPGERRVVFLGDELTENWGRGEAKFFPGKPYFNRGITRQTTAQMLVRFRQDVILLQPEVVVIHAGTNDIAAVTGPSTQGMMVENFTSLVELAQANGIRVVLASILPVCDCTKNQSKLRPAGKIRGMNAWLREYAEQTGSVYLDYYAALADGRELKQELTIDGWLLNDPGYRVMAPLAEKAIAQALDEPAAASAPRR